MIDKKQNEPVCKKMIKEIFDCILVINLAERDDRRTEMETELNRIGFSFSDGSADLLVASKFTNSAGFETIGARGCFDSHLQAMKKAFGRGAQNLLIFEDDCDFISDIEQKLPIALNLLANQRWSLFYGGYLSSIHKDDVSEGVFLVPPDIGLQGSHFVGISGSVLPLLIDYLEKMSARSPGSPLGGPMHVDGAYSWFRRAHPHLETWLAEPQLGFQRPSRTDVHQLRFFDRAPGLRQLVGIARRLKRKTRI